MTSCHTGTSHIPQRYDVDLPESNSLIKKTTSLTEWLPQRGSCIEVWPDDYASNTAREIIASHKKIALINDISGIHAPLDIFFRNWFLLYNFHVTGKTLEVRF